MPKPLYLILPLTLAACDMCHLGNPLTLPARAIGAGVSNAVYDTHRARVRGYLAANREAVLVNGQPGPAWAGLKETARTRPDREAQMLVDFQRINALPDAEWLDQATVIAMVMGDF